MALLLSLEPLSKIFRYKASGRKLAANLLMLYSGKALFYPNFSRTGTPFSRARSARKPAAQRYPSLVPIFFSCAFHSWTAPILQIRLISLIPLLAVAGPRSPRRSAAAGRPAGAGESAVGGRGRPGAGRRPDGDAGGGADTDQ